MQMQGKGNQGNPGYCKLIFFTSSCVLAFAMYLYQLNLMGLEHVQQWPTPPSQRGDLGATDPFANEEVGFRIIKEETGNGLQKLIPTSVTPHFITPPPPPPSHPPLYCQYHPSPLAHRLITLNPMPLLCLHTLNTQLLSRTCQTRSLFFSKVTSPLPQCNNTKIGS
jgi:hypothetical protein